MKSKGTGVVLTVFFGPLGLFYYGGMLGLIATVVGIGISILTVGLLAPVVWLASVLYAAVTDPNKGKSGSPTTVEGRKYDALDAQVGRPPSRPDAG